MKKYQELLRLGYITGHERTMLYTRDVRQLECFCLCIGPRIRYSFADYKKEFAEMQDGDTFLFGCNACMCDVCMSKYSSNSLHLVVEAFITLINGAYTVHRVDMSEAYLFDMTKSESDNDNVQTKPLASRPGSITQLWLIKHGYVDDCHKIAIFSATMLQKIAISIPGGPTICLSDYQYINELVQGQVFVIGSMPFCDVYVNEHIVVLPRGSFPTIVSVYLINDEEGYALYVVNGSGAYPQVVSLSNEGTGISPSGSQAHI